ncbi:MAG: hypothetical protein ACRYFX_31750 [Janthinobacterium lividum]
MPSYQPPHGPLKQALLLVLLAGAAPRLAAQELVPGTYDPAAENLYPRPVAEQLRRQRVRAVLVQQQAPDPRRPGRPLTLTLISYQELDAQGRVISQYWPKGDQLVRRLDKSYDPASHELVSATTYYRLADPTDTTRLGRVWLPESHTSYPPPAAGTGSVATWNVTTGDWQLSQRYRRWQAHDTTYLATTQATTGRLTALDRRYYVGRGQRLQRQDKLTYWPLEGLSQAEYNYVQQEKGRVPEIGQLDFESEFLAYTAAHPEWGRLLRSRTSLPWKDELARHAAGRLKPQATQTYDAHGLVRSRTAAGIRTAVSIRTEYERDAHGQLRQTQYYRDKELWQRTTFSYLPNGLLDRATAFDAQGRQTSTLLYSYRYY